MPSKNALLADKLTAFAPHTIGVRFDRGPDKDTAEHQVFKQLFDVVQLYDSGVDIEEVRRAYDILARAEASYRGGVYRPEDCLRDTLRTSYDITCIDLGRKKFADERFIRSGIDKMRNDVINGFDFTFSVARLYAAKAMRFEKAVDRYLIRPNGLYYLDLDRTWRIGATAHRIISLAESNGSRFRDLR